MLMNPQNNRYQRYENKSNKILIVFILLFNVSLYSFLCLYADLIPRPVHFQFVKLL